MKKILLFFLAFLPIAASADVNGSCGENVTYTFVEATGTLTISGTGAMTDYTSSSSAPWYSYRSKIKTVDIGNGVTSIGNYAFCYCSGLTSVTIPNSVTSIGSCAFDGCSGLTSVTIPNSVTTISSLAFYRCSGLTSVTIGNSVTSIGNSAFYYCSGLTSVTIPNSVTTIGSSAFDGCSDLTSITIPNSVTSIGSSAFDGCSDLTSITVESGNTVYDSRENCNAIIKTSTNELITGCKNTVIPNSVTSIGLGAFEGCSGLTSVTIPNSVTSIGIEAFRYCSGLTSITIPNSVTSIGNNAFEVCSGLTSITVESGNAVYDSRENCNAIIKTSTNRLVVGCKNTTIPNSVTSIGSSAFDGCSGLTSITIPNSVTSIGQYAFYDCSGLTSVTIPNSVTSIDYQAFDGCSGLTSITVESGNTVYDSRENCNAIIKTSTNRLIAGCMNTVIPNSVTSIGNYAFSVCSGLTSVTIPNSVTYIGFCAFYGCSGLTSVTCLAENVPTTEATAFWNSNIGNVTLYVPAGSVAAYQAAAPWNGFGKIVEYIETTDISQIDNVVYIEPLEARKERTELELSIKMKNSAAIRGFQFDLELPEGITPVTEDNEVVCWLNADRSPKKAGGQYYHTLEVSQQADGSYRFLCGSAQNKTFSDNDGEIIVLQVNIADNMAEGDYPIVLKTIKLTETNIDNYYETERVVSKVTILDYVTGDISGDGMVDVSDYIGVANHILGNTPNSFNAHAADVNNDGVIDVSDYIGIANIILTGSIYGNSNNAAPAFEEDAELDPQ